MGTVKIKEVVLKTEEELGGAIGNAWSIGAYNQPKNPVYIGSNKTKWDIFHYFKDDDGKYYFETEGGIKFKQEMEELQRKRKQRRYSRNNNKKISH